MRTITTLLTPVILLSVQQTASAQTRGAIAIEDRVAFESSMPAKAPTKKQLQIKAGEISAANIARTTATAPAANAAPAAQQKTDQAKPPSPEAPDCI